MFLISVSHGGEVKKVEFHLPCDGNTNTGETFLSLLLAIISDKFEVAKMVGIRYKTKRGEEFTIGCDDELRNALLHYDSSSLDFIAEKDSSPEKQKEAGDKNSKDEWKYIPADKAYPKAPLAKNTTSKEVKKLQNALDKLNFLDKKTMEDKFGSYGTDTAQALRNFRGTFAVGIEGPRNKMYSGEFFDANAAKALEQLSSLAKSEISLKSKPDVKSKPSKK